MIHNGYEIQLEWDRGRLFDINVKISILSDHAFLIFSIFPERHSVDTSISLQVAVMFQKLVTEDGHFKVTDTSEEQKTKSRPVGLNTVNLLKVGKKLGKIGFYFLLIKHSWCLS